jgi:hypothetical protein
MQTAVSRGLTVVNAIRMAAINLAGISSKQVAQTNDVRVYGSAVYVAQFRGLFASEAIDRPQLQLVKSAHQLPSSTSHILVNMELEFNLKW